MRPVSVVAALGATLGVVSAHRGHRHENLHRLVKKSDDVSPPSDTPSATCECVTSVVTLYGNPKLVQPVTTTQITNTQTSTAYSTTTVYATGDSPNPYTSFSTTGVYTAPATTITLTSTAVVPCPTASSSDTYPPGTYVRPETSMTVTETNSIYVCPFTSASSPAGEVPVSAPPSQAPAPAAPTTEAPVPSADLESGPAPEPTSEVASSYPASEPTDEAAPSYPAPEPTDEAAPSYPAPESTDEAAPSYPAPEPTSEAAPSYPAPESTDESPPSHSAPESATEAAPSDEAPASSPSSSSGSSPIAGNGNKWGMTYSPYTADGGCKDAGAVSADISAIKSAGFTTVRLYSTDCSGLENVGNACKENGLKIVLGVFIDEKGIDAARPQVTDIISWGQWESVELIVIGNEALFNGYSDVGSLASFIAECKAQFQSAGYDGPCTTTETLDVWQSQGASLCDVVDVLGGNVHPFFNADVTPEDAGPFTAGQLDLLGEVCPGKETYNLESGWPHAGKANGKATPGADYQSTALRSIMENVGAKTVFFSFEDDMWKHPGELGVEQSWGCNNVFSA